LAQRAAAAPAKPAVNQDTVTIDARTEQVIRGSLKFLASRQNPNGSWANDNIAGITGYCMIAFLAAGELPDEGQHAKTVQRGMQYLMSCVRPDGYIAAPDGASNMYGHGIATIALAELFGQTKDPALRPRLEKAVKLIISCQNTAGGWRYAPRPADADISVTVLQVVALRAAKNSGIDVPQKTIDNAIRFVKSCSDGSGGFTYVPMNRTPGFARTAAAIYSLQVCGLYDDPLVKRGSDYLFDTRNLDTQWFTYGNFYAAPAQYMIGGDVWKRWYDGIHGILMDRVQREDPGVAYWTPLEGARGVSEEYATAVYSTILSMPYHYLPLYQR
jgi:prenyltransferase beta subunit